MKVEFEVDRQTRGDRSVVERGEPKSEIKVTDSIMKCKRSMDLDNEEVGLEPAIFERLCSSSLTWVLTTI